MRSHSCGYINQVHEASAKQVAQRVGVVGQDYLRHLGLRIANRPWRKMLLIAVGVYIGHLVESPANYIGDKISG